jgi:holin-like protein
MMPMIRALALLLLCQLIGEIVTRALALSIPGPVIGLALLALGAVLYERSTGMRGAIDATDLGRVTTVLLANLGILFVPAGVGVVQQLPLLGNHGVAIFTALFVSSVLTLIVTAYVFLGVKRAMARWAPAKGES